MTFACSQRSLGQWHFALARPHGWALISLVCKWHSWQRACVCVCVWHLQWAAVSTRGRKKQLYLATASRKRKVWLEKDAVITGINYSHPLADRTAASSALMSCNICPPGASDPPCPLWPPPADSKSVGSTSSSHLRVALLLLLPPPPPRSSQGARLSCAPSVGHTHTHPSRCHMPGARCPAHPDTLLSPQRRHNSTACWDQPPGANCWSSPLLALVQRSELSLASASTFSRQKMQSVSFDSWWVETLFQSCVLSLLCVAVEFGCDCCTSSRLCVRECVCVCVNQWWRKMNVDF